MGSILNPADGNSFLDLVATRESRIFVDKTAFIGETNAVFNTDSRFLAVTRPRQFGKTVAAHMLLAYYSRAYEGCNLHSAVKI